jgi:hypothetical protein
VLKDPPVRRLCDPPGRLRQDAVYMGRDQAGRPAGCSVSKGGCVTKEMREETVSSLGEVSRGGWKEC